MIFTDFLDPGDLRDDDLRLVLNYFAGGDPDRHWVPAYHFDLVHTELGLAMGQIDLRLGETPGLVLYGGQIGYGVHPEWRGRRYAARAVRLLMPLALRHGMRTLWITCNPDNLASRRTCEIAGGIYVETVDLPRNTDLYREGDRQKCRYRFDLEKIGIRNTTSRV